MKERTVLARAEELVLCFGNFSSYNKATGMILVNKKEIIREKYNITSEDYDKLYSEEQVEKYMVAIRKIKVHNKVLDNGCGTALFIEFLNILGKIHRISYYICLDLSIGMLKKAKSRIKKLNLDLLSELVEADAENIPLRYKSVDVTVSFTVVNLLEDKTKGIREIERVTKSCATLSVLKVSENHSTHVLRYGTYIGETSKDKLFVKCYDKK